MHYLSKLYFHLFLKKVTLAKWQLQLYVFFLLGLGIGVGTFFPTSKLLTHVFAASSWAQTDWSGGVGASTVNQYSAATNADVTTTAGQVTIGSTAGWAATYNSWGKRQPITVTNSGAAQTNYQVRMSITYNSSMQSDFDDLRFTNSAGTALDYWLETKTDGVSAIVWVEVDSLAVSGTTTTVYMYYGNASAISNSNGVNTFPLFDNFDDNSFDASKWVKVDPRAKMSEASGKLNFLYGSGSGSWDAGIYAVQSFTRGDWSFEWDQRWTSDYSPYDAFMFGWKDDGSGISYINLVYGYYNQGNGTCTTNCASPNYEDGTGRSNVNSWSNNTDYNLRLRMRASGGAYYEKSTNYGNSWTTDYTSAYSTEGTLHPAWMHYSGDYIIDNVRVRKWMTTEPTSSYGSEDNKYQSSSVLTSNILDTGTGSDWGVLSYTSTTPANTAIVVKVRAGNNADLSDATDFTSCSAVSYGADLTGGCSVDNRRYVQYQITLSTTDPAATPTFSDVTIPYTASDIIPPITNASSPVMYTSSGGTSIPANGWNKSTGPYFTWTAGADDAGGSGLLGYCLYLGTESTSNPANTAGILGTTPVAIPTGSTCGFIVPATSVNLSTSGYLGSALVSNTTYYLNIKAIDIAGNVFVGSSAQFQFQHDSTAPTNVSFLSMPSQNFGNVSDMNFSWPTSGNGIATDSASGVLGWQYQINSTSGSWQGISHEAMLNLDYIPATASAYQFILSRDENPVVTGNNVVYFRALDNAGNPSTDATVRTGNLNYGGAAPAFGGSDTVTVTPAASATNSFALSWPVATANGSKTVTHYYYMINTSLPSTLTTLQGNPSTYLDKATATTVSAAALANVKKGANTVYVVAIDNASTPNYSPSNYIAGTFTLNSTNPDPVQNLLASDSSLKAQSKWNVTLTWSAPTYQGAGNLTYKIYRSADNTTFAQVGSTSGLSYVDNTPNSSTYYYYLATQDGADITSANSTTVSILPTGKWTSAPSLQSGPTVSSITTKKASIAWSTDRSSDSRVAYGTSPGNYNSVEAASSTQATSHSISLTGLSAGTTYYYKAKWTDEDGNIGTSDEKNFGTAAAPTVKNVAAKNIGLTSALIQFTANGATSVKIYYGKTTGFGASSSVSTATTETGYTVSLDTLEDGVKYYYKINTLDSDGSEYEGTVLDFTTLPRPKISNIRFAQVLNTAVPTLLVTWETNTEVSSIVTLYPVGNPSAVRDEVNVALEKGSHQMIIRGLEPQTLYTLVVKGRDKIGNEAVSDLQRFTSATDTRPPYLTEVVVEGDIKRSASTNQNTAELVVSWNTDKPSTSQVEFGEGTGTTYSQKTPQDSNLTFNHMVIITGLAPSQVYHLRANSVDKYTNTGTSIDIVTITPKATDTALNLVVTNLYQVFGFLGGGK